MRTQARVVEVRPDGVRLADGDFIPSELVVWAAGVKGPDLLKDLDGLEAGRSNQLVVTPTLQTTRIPTCLPLGTARFCSIPGDKARSAAGSSRHQQATHLVKQIERRLDGKPLEPFIYRDFGSLVSLGEYSTVGT